MTTQNIGLTAGILSQRTFTIFVVMALVRIGFTTRAESFSGLADHFYQVTTVATTPLTKWLYPPWYQTKMEKWRMGETDKDGNPVSSRSDGEDTIQKISSASVRRLLVYLRLDSLPSLFTFIALLGPEKEASLVSITEENVAEKGEDQATTQPITTRPLEVHGLRILELTERTSSVMQVTEGEEYYSERDPVVNAFRTFSRLNDVAVSGKVAIVPESSYAETLMRQASDVSSDFVLVPWSEYGSTTEDTSVPFMTPAQDRYNGRGHLDFISKTLERSVCNTGIFVNHGFGGMGPAERPDLKRNKSAMSLHSHRSATTYHPVRDKSHQIFLPFFGGVDDRVALRLALQLAKNPHVALTVAHFSWAAHDSDDEVDLPHRAHVANPGGSAGAPEVSGGPAGDSVKVIEETSVQDLALLSSLQSSLPRQLTGRVTVMEINVTRGTAAAEAVAKAKQHVGGPTPNAGDIVVVGRAHAGLGDAQIGVGGGDLKGTVGVVAEQLLNGGVKASVLVVKAGGAGLQW